MEWRPFLHLCVVATEKGIDMSPSTTVANFTYYHCLSGYFTRVKTTVKNYTITLKFILRGRESIVIVLL